MNMPAKHPGFLLVEALLGIAVFGIFVAAVGLTLLYGQESTIMAGDRIRATHYAEQALTAARAVRDGSFASLTPGTHGFAIQPSGVWGLSGSSVTSGQGGYETSFTVAALAADWLRVTARTTWKHGYNRSGSVVLSTDLTNWRSADEPGDWSGIAVDGNYAASGSPQFSGLALFSGSYLLASSRSGDGLYVLNIANTASPQRISGSFSLGAGAYGLAVRGSLLFILTDNPSQEIRVYDIASPMSVSEADLKTTYDLPGSGRGRSILVSGDRLYVGAAASSVSGEAEFYVFAAGMTGSLALLDSIDNNAMTVNAIALSGTAAYLATSMDTGEMRVVDTESGSNVMELGGYNLSDRTLDGISLSIAGNAALLGTQKGSSIAEAVLFDLESGGIPSPPPGPWYKEGSGSMLGIAMDPSRCYGFLAAESGNKALQVFDADDASTLQELATYTSTTGPGRSVLYDAYRDRLFFGTDSAITIFRPASSSGACP